MENYRIRIKEELLTPAVGYARYISRNEDTLDDSQHPEHREAVGRALGLVAYHFVLLPAAAGFALYGALFGLEKLLS